MCLALYLPYNHRRLSIAFSCYFPWKSVIISHVNHVIFCNLPQKSNHASPEQHTTMYNFHWKYQGMFSLNKKLAHPRATSYPARVSAMSEETDWALESGGPRACRPTSVSGELLASNIDAELFSLRRFQICHRLLRHSALLENSDQSANLWQKKT